jgi:antitoxin (DNA-binding transcriptional repressor) of toxin-antitoxin stability system
LSATTSIRELRNSFPKVRKLVETEGEVLLTEKGKPRYRLTLYAPTDSRRPPPTKDYLERLKRHQPRPASAGESAALHEDNRGER